MLSLLTLVRLTTPEASFSPLFRFMMDNQRSLRINAIVTNKMLGYAMVHEHRALRFDLPVCVIAMPVPRLSLADLVYNRAVRQ